MPIDDENTGALWDLKCECGLPSLTKPDPFFLAAYGLFVDHSFPNGGTGLDLAGGLGRHALWLLFLIHVGYRLLLSVYANEGPDSHVSDRDWVVVRASLAGGFIFSRPVGIHFVTH